LAVDLRSHDLVDLLLKNGAEIKGIPFISVLRSWDPKLIQLFLDGGADVVTEYPFAVAFGEKIRTALNRFVAYKRDHPEREKELQGQLDRALRFFAREGDLKWVSLLMWAGGNPRSVGPILDAEDDPEMYESALQAMAYGHNVAVLKRLKPDPECDDLHDLLECASLWLEIDVLQYLLAIGAKPNNKENGGSRPLGRCLNHMHLENFCRRYRTGKASKWELHQSLDSVRELAQHGAVWHPDAKSQLNWIRRTLLECEPEVTIELLKILLENNACSRETLKDLLSTPRIRDHVKESWLGKIGQGVKWRFCSLTA
jgi:hypothetical protein